MNSKEFFEKYKIELNEQQREAVESIYGPTLLLAVPGSGKTTVLVTRLGYMLFCCGIQPEKILTLTYTKMATQDMAHRFSSYFGKEMASKLEFRTINGICAKVIQYAGKEIGKAPFELIKDEKLSNGILSAIYQKHTGDYPTESDLKGVRGLITYIKNMLLSEKEIKELDKKENLPVSDIYKEYCTELKSRSLMDFDDQMVYSYALLKKKPEILHHFQEQFEYICVDEAQDTSKIQHAIIALLVKPNGNLFMVGDEDQSIYGFRAAYPEALLDFKKDHTKAKILLMEKNFRSNGNIVAAADTFIQKNKMRHAKHMVAARNESSEIKLIPLKNREYQYEALAKVAETCKVSTAVLYRDNESVLPLVNLLEKKQIPYKIKNADLTFFSHRIVLDVQNIIKFALNPYDTELFMMIYYKMKAYLNKAAATKICSISQSRHIPVLEAAILEEEIPENTRKNCKTLKTHLERMLSENGEKAIHRLVHSMGYGEYLDKQNVNDNKIFILKAIASQETTLYGFIDRLAELAQIIKEKESGTNSKFILSTIHSSKGLEYDTVYLMDICDGIFPENVITNLGELSLPERKEYEEERRLFYVGITRAKNSLCIFKSDKPSSFCRELLPIQYEEFIVKREPTASKFGAVPKKRSAKVVSEKPFYSSSSHSKNNSDNLEKYQQFCSRLSYEKMVVHKTFGTGEVLALDLEYITIRFADQKRKFSMKSLYEREHLEM